MSKGFATTADVTQALFRRRMALTQAEALIRQGEGMLATMMVADKNPDLAGWGSMQRSQAGTLISAADHILASQFLDDEVQR